MTQWDPQGEPTRQYRRDPAANPYAQAPPPQQPQHQNPFGTEGNDQFGIASMVFSLLGGILLIVCLTALEWFDGGATFGDVRDGVKNSGAAAGFASAYFGWFAWTFLLISVAAAIGASFPSPALRALRVIGVVPAFSAAGLSFLAVQVTSGRSYTDWLGDARIGFYLAVLGFVLIGVGAAIGPRRV